MGVEVIPANDLRWRGGDLESVALPTSAALHVLESCNLPGDSFVLLVNDGAASLQFQVQGTILTIYGAWTSSAAASLAELITWQAQVIPGQPIPVTNARASSFSGCHTTLFHAVHPETVPDLFVIDFTLSPLGQHNGAVIFIYNATLTGPDESSTSRSASSITSTLADATGTGGSGTPTPRISSEPISAHRIALYTSLPIVIFVLLAGAVTALFVRHRRRRRIMSVPTLRPYGREPGDQHPPSDTRNPSAKTQHAPLEKLELAPHLPELDVTLDSPSPPNVVDSESRSVSPLTHVDDAAALLTAVRQSGFSVATVISSLQRQVDAGGQANSDILPPPYAASHTSSREPAQMAGTLVESNHTRPTEAPV
ncbi:hypothetical protein EXIGLDRAFT_407580 [Exidia glandulosa HHB12029]|uniref:Uncharacterized protein n=1 Tax=Exidia glandulosa HHB12029 TaxID=1314781 RepID=A0A165BHM9_EXIGL|nr:hypothetical protein EXIGLDRAFT_407580 [Exidia glandulosa HHB12029]